MLALALAAFGLRLAYAENLDTVGFVSDAQWFHLAANSLAHGHGLTLPTIVETSGGKVVALTGPRAPTAFHPPLFPALLAIGSKLGLTSYGAQRAVGCALGAATVAVIGLIGRRAGGAGMGLLAAGLAAVYPPLIVNDSVLMSESLYGLLIAATILAAMRLADAPSWRRAALLGGAIGLAALTRAEALLLLVLLVPFAVRRAGPRPLRRFLVVGGVALVVVLPWSVRNTTVFDRPVGITTGDGAVLAAANNDVVYHGDRLGGWNFGSLAVAPSAGVDRTDDGAMGAYLRRRGLDYARAHATRVPVVLVARVLRTWGLFPLDPTVNVDQVAVVAVRRRWVQWTALVSAWAVLALALAGAIALGRRGTTMAPLLAPLALVTVVSALFYGDPRFREAAEVTLVVLAAAGLQALWRSARRWRRATPG